MLEVQFTYFPSFVEIVLSSNNDIFSPFLGPLLHQQLRVQGRGQVQGRQRVPRGKLLRRDVPTVPDLRPEAQQDSLPRRICLLQRGKNRDIRSLSIIFIFILNWAA